MKPIKEIRNDLKEIRYYYKRKAVFDEAADSIVVCSFSEKVKKYNNAAAQCSPKLFDMYISLYVKNNTQESLSETLNYTPQYVQVLNQRLIEELQKKLSKKEGKDE